jgi:ankyrin repeat protein
VIVAGDVAALQQLLSENPELIRARSTREHRATLLHYVSANGVEDYRQKTPRNAVRIAEVLLRAGADVDAEADVYGGGATTLGLVATSIHPERAGVQDELIEILLDYGATLERPGSAGNAHGAVVACLANGRRRAAEFLAKRGARLDLEAAAGVGQLDAVRSFFNEDGSLRANATKTQMERGFLWACEYGRTSVVDFLLRRGVDLAAQADTGQTGLHWAVIGGQLGIIRLLLERGASLETLNSYGGTALGQALWSALNGDAKIDYAGIAETLLGAGAKIQDGTLAWLAQQEDRSSPAKARIAEVLKRHGAKS